MKKNTPESYLVEIKEKYELEKQGKHSSYLSKPSPGSLNDLCTLLTNSGLSNIDKEILAKFLGTGKIDIDKFRPICNFFTGRTKTPKQSLFDIMALLVDFEQRPLGKYLKAETHKNQDKVNEWQGTHEVETLKIKEEPQEKTEKETYSEALSLFQNIEGPAKTNSTRYFLTNHKILSITGALILFVSFFITIKTLTKEDQCMTWKKDHFEEIACDAIIEEGTGTVVRKDEHLINSFRKIIPCDTTTFFKNGKACIWYWKTPDDKLDCFTGPGFHPENGKNLKPITQHMIDKYIIRK